jgi:uncharacterized protein involved in outer membrane biogenesis
MNKTKKIWIIVLAAPVVLVVAAVIAANLYLTSERLKSLVVPQLEDAMHRNVSIGDISFSLFPPLVISIENLRISNSPGVAYDRNEFITLDKVNVRVNIFALLGNKVEIDYIMLDHPQIYLEVTADGVKNYSSKQTSKQGSVDAARKQETASGLLLANVEIRNGVIEFVNKKLDSRFAIIGLQQTLKAQSVSGKNEMLVEGTSVIDTLGYGSTESWYMRVHPATADLHLTYNMSDDVLTFNNVAAKLHELPLQVTGKISDLQAETNHYDLAITSPGTTMDQLLSLIPPDMLKKTEGMSSSGEIQLSCIYKGASSETISPGINGKFSVTNGKIQYASLPSSISNINCSGLFEIPEAPIEKKDIGALAIEKFSAMVGSNEVSGDLNVSNFENPYTKANLRGALNLSEVKKYYPLEPGSELAGTMKTNVSLEGKAKVPETMKANGTMEFQNVTIKSATSEKPLRNLNGVIAFNNQVIDSKQMQMTIGKSDLDLAFTMKNYLGMVMKKTAGAKGKPSAKIVLKSKELHTADLMAEEPATPGGAKNSTAPEKKGGMLPGIDIDAQVNVDKLVTEKFTFNNAHGIATIADGLVNLKNMSVDVFNGHVQSKGTLDLRDPKKSPFDLDLDIKGVESNALLSNFTSFGKYLFGKFSTTTKLKGDLNDTLGLNTQTLFGDGVVDMADGKLLGFPLTQKLADVTSLTELREVNFKNWTNAFSISNGRLNIKDLKVNSGSTDFVLGGSQGFDGSMDYALTVKLPSSVSDRLKLGGAADQLLQFMKDKDGRLNLAFDVGGTSMSPSIRLNPKAQENAAKTALEQKAGDAKKKLEDDLKKKAEEGLKKLFKRP